MSEEKYCKLFDEFLETVDGFEPQSIIYFDEEKAKEIDRLLKKIKHIENCDSCYVCQKVNNSQG